MSAPRNMPFVDDRRTLRPKRSMVVNQLGHTVENTADSSESLQAIRACPRDSVVLDLLIP